jgi:hypothetical protein
MHSLTFSRFSTVPLVFFPYREESNVPENQVFWLDFHAKIRTLHCALCNLCIQPPEMYTFYLPPVVIVRRLLKPRSFEPFCAGFQTSRSLTSNLAGNYCKTASHHVDVIVVTWYWQICLKLW